MADADRKRRRDQFKREEGELRMLLNERDPIPGSPDDEYDCLVHDLLSHLHRGVTREDLLGVIGVHSKDHVGAAHSPRGLAMFADSVWQWWCKRTEPRKKVA